MAVARIKEFPNKDIMLSEWCKALAHPARISILKALAKRKVCICGELVIDLPLAQSTVSQHLKALQKAGLIQGKVDGPRSKYCINKKNFKTFVKVFNKLSTNLNENLRELKC